jgi:hypothetical protein
VDWSNERYVRLYTRDSTTWKLLDWRGRMVFMLMMRKATRAGVIDVDGHGAIGLAALIEAPIDIVEAGIAQLTDPRIAVVVATPTAYVIPKFLEAQEAVQTTAHRSREYRARQRDEALAVATKRDATVTKRGATVTKTDSSPEISSLLSDPNRSYPEREAAGEITTATEPPDSPKRSLSRGTEPAPNQTQTGSLRALGDEGMASLNAIRARLAHKFGWSDLRPLHPMDPCRTDLQARLREAGDRAAEQLEHVLRIAELEAVAKKTSQYLGGGIFSERSWSKKLAMREADAVREIGSWQAEAPKPARIKRGDDDMPPMLLTKVGKGAG